MLGGGGWPALSAARPRPVTMGLAAVGLMIGGLAADAASVAIAGAADTAPVPSVRPRPARPQALPGLNPGDLIITLEALTPNAHQPRADGPGPCRATLRLDNRSSVTIHTFSMALLVFDAEGVLRHEVAVLAMPLPGGGATVVDVPVWDGGCASLGSLRLRAFPLCGDESGRPLGCRGAAIADSRVAVPLEL